MYKEKCLPTGKEAKILLRLSLSLSLPAEALPPIEGVEGGIARGVAPGVVVALVAGLDREAGTDGVDQGAGTDGVDQGAEGDGVDRGAGAGGVDQGAETDEDTIVEAGG